MTKKQVKEIVFNSEIHKWSENNSEFDQKLNGKKNIIVLIEDERKNLFGGYIGNEIQIWKYMKDESCYLFSLRKNGKYRFKKYLKNETGYSYIIPNDSSDGLMAFGVNNNRGKDITLYKKDYSSGYCEQECYEYSRQTFTLTGKCCFNIKRIVIYQLQ